MNRPDRPVAAQGNGERKQITPVFIDLVGSSEITSTTNAADLQPGLHDYCAQSRDIMNAHGGKVAEYPGGGGVMRFGLTQAASAPDMKTANDLLNMP